MKQLAINFGYIASFGLLYSMYNGFALATLGCAFAVIASTVAARLIK